MEQKCVLDFEDKSREAAAREREDRIGKVSKDEIERTVVDEICRYPKYSARQIANKLGVTPSKVREIRVRFAAEIERRTGVKLRLQPGDADGLYPEARERMDMMDAVTDGCKAAEAAAPNTGFVLVPEPGNEGGETDGTEKRVVKQEQMPNGMVHVFTEKVEEDIPHQSPAVTASPLGSQGATEDVNFVLMSDDVPEETLAHDMKATFGDVARVFGRLSGEPENAVRHRTLCNYLNTLYARKNADYGDSFHQLFEEEGIVASRIRLGDKLNRFKKLSRGYERNEKDESIRDTLIDLANYAIMTVMELDRSGK